MEVKIGLAKRPVKKAVHPCRLANVRVLWEIPGMSIVTADDYKRVRIPDAKPGQAFAYELSGNVVKLTPIKTDEQETPIVKMVKGPNGLYRFAGGAKLSREEIIKAIREDRDSR